MAKIALANAARSGRRLRMPDTPFIIRQQPWSITPFCIFPVLPGETLKNLRWQARAVTDPIKNPLIGWWLEYYFFYIKHRDLEERQQFEQMMLDPTWTDDAVDSQTTNRFHYYDGSADGINWIDKCLKRICDGAGAYGGAVTYFRDTGEAWNLSLDGNGLPRARAFGQDLYDSLRSADALETEDVVLDTSDDEVTASEIDAALRTWSALSEMGLTDMTYEDYLATFGTRVRKEELHVPELLRFVRRWQYPSNTVDPATGEPSSAVSWVVQERADKDRFFKEPGFIFGVTVARPKVYRGTQHSTATAQLNTLDSWLPAMNADSPISSWRKVNDTLFPVTDTDGAVIDMKDLFLYGEQFTNYQPGEANSPGHHFVGLPTGGLGKKYVADADVKALWVDQDVGGEDPHTATKIYIRQDGIVSCAISGRQVDTSITRPST